MLNNKKNLLQRVRIAMVAIVTIIGIGGAYATTLPSTQAGTTYGVLATSANSYQVTAVTADSRCTGSSGICEVRSTATPDASGNIPKAGATTVQAGVFHNN